MIEVVHQHPRRRFSSKETRRTVDLVLKKEARNARHLSVVFTDDRYMRLIHGKFLGSRTTTDVMAFALEDGFPVEGEVYVNLDQARRQAVHYGVPMAEEVRRLLIHGTLHLVGYRDATPLQRRRMKKREDTLLKNLGSRD